MRQWVELFRHTTLLFLVLAVGLALVLFSVKYQVQDLEEELSALNRELAAERKAVRVAQAEWSYLTEPERLLRLSKRHLRLEPLRPDQLGSFTDLPIPPPPADGGAKLSGGGLDTPLPTPPALAVNGGER